MAIQPLKRIAKRLLSLRDWKTRLVFWSGAILVGLAAVGFAVLSEHANGWFRELVEHYPYAPFLLSPLMLAFVAWLTTRHFNGTQGSGIPQAMAALELRHDTSRNALLALRVGLGKIALTVLGLLGGASIGREGPTVHVGAAIMHSLGRFARFPRHYLDRGLILAGSAAGIAAAFNTPLAGIVFAIEEMSRSFEERTSGTILTAVVLAGATAVVLQGNYTYFGSTAESAPLTDAWLAALTCGVVGGLLGGGFSRLLVCGSRWLAPVYRRRAVWWAAGCGLALAGIGWLSGGSTYGTGYQEASQLVTGAGGVDETFPFLKLVATLVSYLSGIPGGIFAPSLATGAGLGPVLSPLFPEIPVTALVVLAMAGYFAGVTQTPITTIVIVMEMTDTHSLLLPIMIAGFLGYVVSRSVCRQPIYTALAKRFVEAEQATVPPDRPGGRSDSDTNPERLV